MEISFFITYLLGLSYIALIVFPFIGSIGFPFSEEVFFLAVGYVVSTGFLNYSIAVFLCLIGVMMGENLAFVIGLNGGKYFNFLVPDRKLRKVEKWSRAHGAKAVFFAKMIPGLRFFVPFFAGASNMKYSTFFFYNAIGSAIMTTFFVTVGYVFGASISYVEKLVQDIDIFLLLSALILLAIFAVSICFFRKTVRRRMRETRFLDRWLKKDELPFQMVTFGNPCFNAKRIVAKTRNFDGKINVVIGDIKRGSLKKMTSVNNWLNKRGYKSLLERFSKSEKPKIEEWE